MFTRRSTSNNANPILQVNYMIDYLHYKQLPSVTDYSPYVYNIIYRFYVIGTCSFSLVSFRIFSTLLLSPLPSTFCTLPFPLSFFHPPAKGAHFIIGHH